jgi:hypothetical protein
MDDPASGGLEATAGLTPERSSTTRLKFPTASGPLVVWCSDENSALPCRKTAMPQRGSTITRHSEGTSSPISTLWIKGVSGEGSPPEDARSAQG